LNSFAQLIQGYLTVRYDWKFELMMVVGQVFFQWMFMLKSSWSERYEYLLLALTVSMIGGVMLFPLLILNSWSSVPPSLAIAYFFLVVFAIFIAHFSLIQQKHLPVHLTITWIVYRCLLLLFVTL
jgi:hypothetical protein